MNTLFALITALSFPAATVTNGICEVNACLPLPIEAERMESVAFTLVLATMPSNNLEIAIGCDRDSDGALSMTEADYRFGYDCGEWFADDVALGYRGTSAADAGTVTNRWTLTRKTIDDAWNLIRLTRRGADPVNASLTMETKKTKTIIIIR